jgi:hypothetical protein
VATKDPLAPGLRFTETTPIAPRGLGGLATDYFSNGRLFASIGSHGGLLRISYAGDQHLGALGFFQGSPETAWTKLFRPCAGIDGGRFYLTLNETKLYPFGLASRCEARGVGFKHELLLLPDVLVQRFHVLDNPKDLRIFVELFHHERVAAIRRQNRTWSDLEFDPKSNAIIACCTDENPTVTRGEGCLSQADYGFVRNDSPHATTWIGMGCDTEMKARFSHNRFKLYLTSEPIQGKAVAFFLAFATTRKKLEKRLAALANGVHRECDRLVKGYEERLQSRPRIDIGNPVLNSAFMQYPEVIHQMKVSDRPGAVRAAASRSFVWGWDGMTPTISSALANEPDFTAAVLRFFQEVRHSNIGLPLEVTTSFSPSKKEPFPAQCQYIAGLYHYFATTGDLSLAREVMPTCRFILDRCRKDIVGQTGLVAANALWPDFPEAMGENGHDISSLNNSLLYQALRAMEYLAGVLGDAKRAREYREWGQRLRVHFVKHLYDEEKGYFISSCSSDDLEPRKHYCCQAIFWITPFARELVCHAPGRIATFMQKNLRSEKCLLSLPTWDTAWMADGNQLGSSFPPADYFYLNVHKLIADDVAIKSWLGDVEWFWRFHTVPEAFTPEAENEHELGPDATGQKQTQACATWYASFYQGLAGLDFDHEGFTLTPWGDLPVNIRGLHLHGTSLDLSIRGQGRHIGTLKLNGRALPSGSRKIFWKQFKGKTVRIDLVRSEKAPKHPVIVRADGLRVTDLECRSSRLSAAIDGQMSGEVVIQATAKAKALVNGRPVECIADASTGTICVPFLHGGRMQLTIEDA